MIVISGFDISTNFVKPWADAGFTCYCVDIQNPPGETKTGNIVRVGCDIHKWNPPKKKVAFAAFFPPCTHLAISGARWFKGKGLYPLADSIKNFAVSVKLAEMFDCPYVIENPMSTISTYWRKPDHKFDPCDFGGYLDPPGDAYTKETWLWVGGGFVMPEYRPVFPIEGSKMHKMGPSEDRANLRSETPMGFAKAVFQYNKPERVAA
jgi:hypothetical protein